MYKSYCTTHIPLTQRCAVTMCPLLGSQGTETGTSLPISPHQEAAEKNEVASQPPFVQTGQPKCPQPLMGFVL